MNSFVPYCHTKAFSTYEYFLFANSLTGITGFQPERRHFCCIKVQLGRLRFAAVVVVEYLGAALYHSPLTLLRRSCAQVSCLCLFNHYRFTRDFGLVAGLETGDFAHVESLREMGMT